MALQFSDCNRLITVGDYVGNQALIAGPMFTSHDHSLPHSGMLAEHRLDLAQFDPETANFHLVIHASQTLDASVRSIASQVTGIVQACARLIVEGMTDKALC